MPCLPCMTKERVSDPESQSAKSIKPLRRGGGKSKGWKTASQKAEKKLSGLGKHVSFFSRLLTRLLEQESPRTAGHKFQPVQICLSHPVDPVHTM